MECEECANKCSKCGEKVLTDEKIADIKLSNYLKQWVIYEW